LSNLSIRSVIIVSHNIRLWREKLTTATSYNDDY